MRDWTVNNAEELSKIIDHPVFIKAVHVAKEEMEDGGQIRAITPNVDYLAVAAMAHNHYSGACAIIKKLREMAVVHRPIDMPKEFDDGKMPEPPEER